MGIDIPFGVIAGYALGLVLLYVIGWFLLVPLKFIFKLVINGIIGGIMLWILNIAGEMFGITVGINPITALVAGFLGVPGIIMLLLLKYIILNN